MWGPLYAKNIQNDTLYEVCNNSPIEKLNLKLCKFLLGVHRKSTNAAVRGELGRYPLLINILNLAIRYRERIFSLKNDNLVKMSCMDDFILSCDSSWSSITTRICNEFGGSSTLKTNLEQTYSTKWSLYIDSCQSDGKLKMYSHFKKSFKLENYLLQFPPHFRRNYSKLRISAHNLAIETGRYTKPTATPIEKRLCFHCKEVEDEYHLILKCPLYAGERE